jgi:riboflavin kinase/FMN adenylyltransferase
MEKKYVCAIGNFDGVHIGHQKLFDVVKKIAKENSLKTLVYTFDKVAKLNKNYIYSFDIKLQILKLFQFNEIHVLKFDKICKLSPTMFFEQFIVNKNVSVIIAGEDFKFGKNATGDVDLLCKLGRNNNIAVFILKDFCIEIDGKLYSVSSSLIRNKILECDFDKVEIFLGREYYISGRKVSGLGLAKRLGFPTINFLPEENLLVPHGVIAGYCKIKNKVYPSVANFGFKPTIIKSDEFVVEIHVIDKKILVDDNELVFFRPVKKIRDEQKFTSLTELSQQIKKDIMIAKNVLGTGEKLCKIKK